MEEGSVKLVSLKRSGKKAKSMEQPVSASREYYPWGFRLELDQETIPKFKALAGANVGSSCKIKAVGKVVSMSTYEDQGDKTKRQSMTIQIEKIAIHSKDSAKDAFDEYSE
jgi:Major coat protein-like